MLLWLRDPKNKSATEERKIEIVISYIRGDKVDSWVENLFDAQFSETEDKWKITWAAFAQLLQERFVDSNQARQAQIKIENLKQGKDTAEEFFQNFEILKTQAGYAADDAYLIKLLEQNVQESIIDKIYNREQLPEGYEAWKKAIITHDSLWQRRQESKKLSAGAPSRAHALPLQQKDTARTSLNTDRELVIQRNGTGVTYRGSGMPMDIDRAKRQVLCFTCGQRGHKAFECPTRKKMEVRQMVDQMDENDRAEIFEILSQKKERKQDFAQGQA